MESHLATLVEQAAGRGKPLSLLVLDIDYFKAINDTHGHDAGDDVLREFAVRVKKSIRGIDLACRYGGEEFVVVMPETDMAVAALVAERIRRRIAGEPFAIEQGAKAIDVTLSIGLAALGSAERHRRQHPEARRPGALSRQARRPQPRRGGRGVSGDSSTGLVRRSPQGEGGFRVNPNALHYRQISPPFGGSGALLSAPVRLASSHGARVAGAEQASYGLAPRSLHTLLITLRNAQVRRIS